MWSFLKKLFVSKKVRALAVGAALTGLKALETKTGVAIPEDVVYLGDGLLGAYILGQGMADSGKEAEKLRQAGK